MSIKSTCIAEYGYKVQNHWVQVAVVQWLCLYTSGLRCHNMTIYLWQMCLRREKQFDYFAVRWNSVESLLARDARNQKNASIL